VVLVGTGAEEVEITAIVLGAFLHEARDLHFTQAIRDGLQCGAAQRRWNLVEQIVDLADAERLEHGGDIGFGVRNKRHG
jgi:hypothetical protein